MKQNPLGRPIRVLSVYPTFWPRQGGGQMVLAAIARGLSPHIVNTVLTRRLHDTPAHEDYEFLSVERFWNPSPAVWKEYATGIQHIPFWKRSIVTGIDIFCALNPLRRLMAQHDLVHLHFPLPLGISVLLVRALVKRPVVVTVHGNADVYVMPSVSEPFGLTALEALQHGTPVIVSRSAGVSEVVKNVLRVRFGDVEDLASKILSVLLFPPLRQALSTRGREDVERLSWRESAWRCLTVYRELVGE